MKPRSLLILLGIFVILIIAVMLQSQPQQITINPAATLNQFLQIGRELNFAINDILAVRLRNPGQAQEFVLSRDSSGNWTAPQSQGVLDQEAVSNILKTVVLLPYQNTAPIDASTDLRQYGFTPQGQLAVEILLQNGQTHAIQVGGLSPSGAVYYALADDIPQIYLLERSPVAYLIDKLNHPPLT